MENLLFSPLRLRGLELRNRIVMSPMCQYSAVEGVAQDWHLMHLGARAVGGVGLIVMEATGVSSQGRITEQCLGLWNQDQVSALEPIVRFVKAQGCAIGIQLAHSGRKSWNPVSENPDKALMAEIKDQFRRAARLAVSLGFDVIEVHAAHGYLLHSFLSPLGNHRSDDYGGSLDHRMRFPLEVVECVRAEMPENMPLMVRISATDWAPSGGWEIEQSLEFVRKLKERGVDVIDTSTGGLVSPQSIPVAPEYQVPFAEVIRRRAQVVTGAVGLITRAEQAEAILQSGKADLIFLGRELLRNPHWALMAAAELGVQIPWPKAYERAKVGS